MLACAAGRAYYRRRTGYARPFPSEFRAPRVITAVDHSDDMATTLRELRRAITDEFIAKLPRDLSLLESARLFGVSSDEFSEWVRLGAVTLESGVAGGPVMRPSSNRALFDEPRVLHWDAVQADVAHLAHE